MYWVCDECSWENEYSDEIKYTECQCCGALATEKNLSDARKALARFHREEERRKREEAIRQKKERQQEIINRVSQGAARVLRVLPKVNLIVLAIAISLGIGKLALSGTSYEVLSNHFASNLRELRCFEQIGNSIETSGQLLSERFVPYVYIEDKENGVQPREEYSLFLSNMKLIGSNTRSYKNSLFSNFDILHSSWSTYLARFDDNKKADSNMNSDIFILEDNPPENRNGFAENIENFLHNLQFFHDNASKNISKLFDRFFKE